MTRVERKKERERESESESEREDRHTKTHSQKKRQFKKYDTYHLNVNWCFRNYINLHTCMQNICCHTDELWEHPLVPLDEFCRWHWHWQRMWRDSSKKDTFWAGQPQRIKCSILLWLKALSAWFVEWISCHLLPFLYFQETQSQHLFFFKWMGQKCSSQPAASQQQPTASCTQPSAISQQPAASIQQLAASIQHRRHDHHQHRSASCRVFRCQQPAASIH